MIVAMIAGASLLAAGLMYKKYHTAKAALAAAEVDLAMLKGAVRSEVLKLEGRAEAEVVAAVAKIKSLL